MRQRGLDQSTTPDGRAPVAWLFERLAHHSTQAAPASDACFHGVRPLAVDGMVWATPDTPSNRQALSSTANQYRPAPWPQIRATCLMDTHTTSFMPPAQAAWCRVN